MSPRLPAEFATWSLADQLTWLAAQIPNSRNGRVIIAMLDEAAGEIRLTMEQWRRSADAFTALRSPGTEIAKPGRKKAIRPKWTGWQRASKRVWSRRSS